MRRQTPYGEDRESRSRKGSRIFLGIASALMVIGLVLSYSRGAWLATAIGLCYMAWRRGRLKWRPVLALVAVLGLGAWYFWGHTSDLAPWYLKRVDFGRPSAQHRVSAWRAGFQMMWDHPLGLGWNKAVTLYEKRYAPPEGGGGALMTNDYLMIGTELGVPALLGFAAYLVLVFRRRLRVRRTAESEGETLRTACLSAALVLVVTFWFDGGLFKLPTGALFWVLLELGAQPENVI